ncbi:MAG: DUF5911 domain-containing protein, partial [Syntrophales bacterium]|nr:DUF5911 domain-containing protein [Syntrophales bacterium]
MINSLELGLIGNCRIGALINPAGEIVWSCLPRFDGDPIFCSLLREHDTGESTGYCTIELEELTGTEQFYLTNSAVLVTRLTDRKGAVVEITDFSPRFRQHGRMFTPMMMIRYVKRLHGAPRVRIRVRPTYGYGRHACSVTYGSHHIRYVAPDGVL